MQILKAEAENIVNKALKVLRLGGILVYPTETAYGIGVDATSKTAVDKLLKYKKRPAGKAISVGCADEKMAEDFVEINPSARNIYMQFLPGPVTVVSKSKGKVDKRLESDNGNLGIRIPANDLILEIIKKFGKPITTTSANQASKKTPYSISDILDSNSKKANDMLDLIIDGGELQKSMTSSVVDTTTEELTTYRAGLINPVSAKVYYSKSVEETIKLGKNLLLKKYNKSKPNIFLLEGNLGAGKTHFVKGIGEELGVKRIIKSPTYIYVNEYKLKDGLTLFHLDAWRLQNVEDLKLLRIKSWIKPGNVIAIEWPNVILELDQSLLGDLKTINIQIQKTGETNRKIVISD